MGRNNNKRRIFLTVLGSMAGGCLLARLIPVEAQGKEVIDAGLVRNVRSFLAAAEEKLDVKLSTRASEETLTSIKNKIDQLKFDSEGKLLVNAGQIAVEAVKIKADDGSGSIAEIYRAGNALLVAVDQDKAGLAKEETLQKLANALQSIASDKILVAPDNPPNLDIKVSQLLKKSDLQFDANGYLIVNVSKITNPPNLDIKLSELKNELPREVHDIVLDDGSGVYGKILRTGNSINVCIKRDDSGILKKSDLQFDEQGRLLVNAGQIAGGGGVILLKEDTTVPGANTTVTYEVDLSRKQISKVSIIVKCDTDLTVDICFGTSTNKDAWVKSESYKANSNIAYVYDVLAPYLTVKITTGNTAPSTYVLIITGVP